MADGACDRVLADKPDEPQIGKARPQALDRGRGSRIQRQAAFHLGDEIEKVFPVHLGGKHAVRGRCRGDDAVQITVVILRIAQDPLDAWIEVRDPVEIRPRPPRDPGADQCIAEKRAAGPFCAADQIR